MRGGGGGRRYEGGMLLKGTKGPNLLIIKTGLHFRATRPRLPFGVRKNVVWITGSCQIPSDKIFISAWSDKYFHLKFSDGLNLIANKILWKIGREMIKDSPENSCFIGRNSATFESSCGVLLAARQCFWLVHENTYLPRETNDTFVVPKNGAKMVVR